ncbi:hypothetical protein NADFUDRAFT_50837 [Nadsonia fulvescens var. elongata DSM 6958]|uniref:MINDY deubiquitinase domain-containing protein n=1 Tax=Nadsonia fulvescens var. elongata DSM 6958 TaxID=857566 RepID=A0A1E3PKS0_9ASCO|nr:hypothetical protein NADFUDRAFT_50837 [Nadsonia fulvescens var. elongata DSM 6958]
MSCHSESTTWFALKRIEWINNSSHTCTSYIILQNGNGPCALIALANVLVLTGRTFGEDNLSVSDFTFGKSEITVDSLLEFLASCLIAKNELLAKDIASKSSDNKPTHGFDPIINPDERDLDDVLKLLPNLVTGLSISPRFDGTFDEPNGSLGRRFTNPACDRFTKGKANAVDTADEGGDRNGTEDTNSILTDHAISELSLFRAYNIDLVHGWVCDPFSKNYPLIMQIGTFENLQLKLTGDDNVQNNDYDQRNSNDYEYKHNERNDNSKIGETDPAIVATQIFIDTYSTQLSEYGLHFLREIIDPGSISVIFLNNHFATIYNEPITRTLYLLVTDTLLSQQNSGTIVWESLVDVKGNLNEFYTGSFKIIGDSGLPGGSEVAEPLSETLSGFDSDSDLAMAKIIQLEEDERMAKDMDSYYMAKNQKHNTTKKNSAVDSQFGKAKSKSKSKNKEKPAKRVKDDKKCTLM